MTQDMIGFITDFGDEAVMLPVTSLVAGMLAWARWWRGLATWCSAVGGTLAAIFVLKVVSLVWIACWSGPGLGSPSGHTAASTAIYGSIGVLVLHRSAASRRWAVGGAGLIATLIGTSRLLLGVHSVADVLAGAAVGMAGVAAFATLSGPVPALLRPRRLVVITAMTALALHGYRLPVEALIRSTSRCPIWFVRA